MTERERWIVYPLLFLALGAALRDKLVERTTTKSIVCEQLLIVDEESSGPQSQRTLAKIGKVKPSPGGKSTASLQINGDVEIIDNDLDENSQARILVQLGRTDPRSEARSNGYAIVRGELAVEGVLDVTQYAWKHMPVVPVQVAPGVLVLGLLPAAPPAGPKAPGASPPKTQPPTSGTKNSPSSTPPSSPAAK